MHHPSESPKWLKYFDFMTSLLDLFNTIVLLFSVLDSGTIFYFNNIIRFEIRTIFMYKGFDHKFSNREKQC